MTIDISIQSEFLDDTPNNSMFLHLTIICGALKFCLGQSKKMSFIKLAYIFDKTINLESGAFSSKITLSPWLIGADFKKSLVISEAHEYIEFHSKDGKGIKISISSKGEEYISNIEGLNIFQNYLDYLREIKLAENRFESPTIRCETNVY